MKSTPTPPERWRLTHARASVESDPEGWREVTLPARIYGDGTLPTRVRYRFDVDVKFPSGLRSDLWAAYLPTPTGHYTLFINDRLAAITGPDTKPLPVHGLPLFLEFSAALLDRERNRIEFRCLRERPSCALQELYIGPRAELAPYYNRANLSKRVIPRVILASTVCLALTMLALFTLRSHDAVFSWHALALLCWAAREFIVQTPRSPFPLAYLWPSLEGVAVGGYIVCGAFFVNRLLAIRAPRAERALLVWFALGTTSFLLGTPFIGSQAVIRIYDWAWLPVLHMVFAFQTWRLLQAARRQVADAGLLCATSWFLLVVGSRDIVYDSLRLPMQAQYFNEAVGLGLLASGFVLVRRFARALRSAEGARDQLESRVAQRAREIEQQALRLKDLERERAIAAERDRVGGVVSETIGGALRRSLAEAETRTELQGAIPLLQNCLSELNRLHAGNLPDLAAALRAMRDAMLAAVVPCSGDGQVRWQLEALPPALDIGAARTAHALAIVREAIANAIKHANCSDVIVRAYIESDGIEDDAKFVIEIADNGCGLQMPAHRGYGIASMRWRAQQLRGELTLDELDQGAVVRLIASRVDASPTLAH